MPPLPWTSATVRGAEGVNISGAEATLQSVSTVPSQVQFTLRFSHLGDPPEDPRCLQSTPESVNMNVRLLLYM